MSNTISHHYKATVLFAVLLSCCLSAWAQTRKVRLQHGTLVYKVTNLADTFTVEKEESPDDPIFLTRSIAANIVGDKLGEGTEINIDVTYYPDDNSAGVCSSVRLESDERLTCLNPDYDIANSFPKTFKDSESESIPDNPEASGYSFSHSTRKSPHHLNHTFRVNRDITERTSIFNISVSYYVWNNKTEIDCGGGYDETTRCWEIVRPKFVDAPLADNTTGLPFDIGLFATLMQYFGLDQHATPKEAMTIAVISMLLSLLLGGIGAGAIGGAGAGVGAGGFTEPLPGGEPPSIPPGDGKLFHSTDYPDLCERYVREDAEGTLTVTDPTTGKKTEYYPTEDGKWVRYYGDDNPLTNADIEERVRFSHENSDYVRQNAETAARNRRLQREAWDAMNKRDLERGYSDEMKEYRDWKTEQERIQKQEDYIEKLADKYHTTVDNLKDKIRQVQNAAEEESLYQQEIAKHWDRAVTVANVVDNTCEFAVNVMGECVPGGRVVKNAYTFAKSTLVAASEAYAEGKSLGEGAAHVMVGMGKGALGVIQNQAGDLTKNPLGEYAITVGTEMVKDGMTVYEKTGDVGKTMYGMINSGAKKTGDFMLGKLISGGMNKLKTGAEQSLQKGIININDDAGIRMRPETAKKILNFFNPKGGLNSTGAKGWDIEIKGSNSSTFNADMNKWKLSDLSKNFSVKGTTNVTSGGTFSLPGMVSTKATEAASKFGLHDWEGHTAEGLTRDAVNLKKDLANFKDTLKQRALRYGQQHGRK